MIVNKMFKDYGEPTECSPIEFVRKVHERELIHQSTTVEEMQQRYKAYFEGLERYEYTVKDDNGDLLALMVIGCEVNEIHLGKDVLVPTMVYSLQKGLLSGAYRWLFELAKQHGIEWVKTTRTDAYTITTKYKQVKK